MARGTALTRTGKTNRQIDCNPPNKKCGQRCIPPEWECRLEGKGTNPALKVVKSDPLAGVASVQRGTTDLVKGVSTLNPARIQRGRSSIIRGIVKIAPGDGLEDKNKLRRRLEEGSSAAFAITLVGVLGVLGHRGLKTSRAYREGWGRDIDRAALRAVNSLLDITPGVAGRRNAIRAAATRSQIDIVRSLQKQEALVGVSRTAASNMRRMGPIGGFGDRVGAPNSPILADAALRTRIRAIARDTTNADQFAAQATEALFSGRPGSRNMLFSRTAAETFLNSQFRLGVGSNINPRLRVPNGMGGLRDNPQASLTEAGRRDLVVSTMATRFQDWGRALRADMQLRGYADPNNPSARIPEREITRYIREQALPIVQRRLATLPMVQASQADSYEQTMRRIIQVGDNNRSARTLARATYEATVRQYDSYFNDVIDRMSRGATAADSPFGDGKVALAKYLRGGEVYNPSRGTGPVRVISREHADLLIRDWYHRRAPRVSPETGQAVSPGRTRPFEVSAGTAQRIAQRMQRNPDLPTPEAAITTLRRSGLNVRLAGGTPPRTPSRAATTRTSTASQPRSARRRTRSRSDIILDLIRAGYSRTAATTEADRIIAQRRTDAYQEAFAITRARLDAPQTGKPCGESHIPKEKKCHTPIKAIQTKTSVDKEKIVNKLVTAYLIGFGLWTANDVRRTIKSEKLRSHIEAGRKNRKPPRDTTPDELAKQLGKLKGKPGVNDATIDAVSQFVRGARISVENKVSASHGESTLGFWSPGKPSVLHVPYLGSRNGSLPKPDALAVSKTGSFVVNNVKHYGVLRRHGVSSQHPYASAEQHMLTTIHELGHALHGRGGFRTPAAVTYNGRKYTGKELTQQLNRNVTNYGRTDLRYGRFETFAEYFSMYVTAGETLKRKNPVAWAWTKATVDHALAGGYEISPDAAASIVSIVNKSRLGIPSYDAMQTSTPEFLRDAHKLAIDGKPADLRTLIQNFEGDLTDTQYEAVTSLIETAEMYAFTKARGPLEPLPEVVVDL